MILKPPKLSKVNFAHPLARRMVYCGVMNEGHGTVVFDVNGGYNVGTITGALWKPGQFGPCLWHDGSGDYTTIPHHHSLYFADRDFAISTWIKTTTSHTGIIIAKGDASGAPNDAYQLYVRTSDPYVRLFTQNNLGVSSQTAAMSTNIHDGKWHHIIAQRIGNRLQIFIDSILKSDETLTLRVCGSTNPVYIGRRINSGSENLPFQGNIDTPMMWSRSLSQDEVTKLFSNPFCMFEREPIELWSAAIGTGAAGDDYYRTVDDSLDIVDSDTRTHNLVRILSESLGIEDVKKKDEIKVIVEALGLTDIGFTIGRSVILQQLLGIVDSISGLDYTRNIDDDVDVVDSILRVVEMPRVISESLGVSDTTLHVLAIMQTIDESLGIEDNVLRTAEILRTIVEVLDVVDNIAGMNYLRTINDDMSVEDDVLRILAMIQTIDDDVGIEDSILRAAGMLRIISDNVDVEDDVFRTVAILRNIAESLDMFDEISTADLVTAALVFMVIRQTHI